MTSTLYNDLNRLLEGLAEGLDISETQYETAVRHYEAVGDWLSKDKSPIAAYDPRIFPQGSFRLGTMIKPVTDIDLYDIDLVCEMQALVREHVTQTQLKEIVGDRLRSNDMYQKMLEEKSRCWRLRYADSTRFYMDILPAIPDYRINEIAETNSADLLATSLLITDKNLRAWQRSNPIGYSEWFKEQMRIQFDAKRLQAARALNANVDEVLDYKIKTPLQRAIQILKRHRDIMFYDDHDDQPISIIITTLAAQAYENEADLIMALERMVHKMPTFIERDAQGNAIIPNPVNPAENFADKWKEHPQRETKFRRWLARVAADVDGALGRKNLDDLVESLKPRFGDRVVNQVASHVFPGRYRLVGSAAATAPQITISKPGSKPWGE